MKKICSVIIMFTLAVFLLLTTASITQAEVAGPFYVGIFGGYVIPQDLKLEGNGDSENIGLDNSWAIGAKAGYIIPAVKWLAVELEYTYLAKQNIDKPGLEGDFRAHNAMANLLFRYPEGIIHPYAGGGLGWSWDEVRAQDAGGAIDSHDGAFAWQLVAGVNFEITPNLSVDLSYKYFTSEYDVASDGKVQDHIIALGLSYYFGGEEAKPVVREAATVREEAATVQEEAVKAPVREEAALVKNSDCDNVPDNLDKCPDTPCGCVVDKDGCPIDSDKDGVCDGLDKCPGTPEGCKVDKDGCPIDSDKDGVCDGLDKCPGTPEGCKVDKDGCPIDSDKDGVIDCLDKCPGTPEGAKVDKDGCTIWVSIRLNVEFDFDKAIVKPEYYDEIKRVADFMNAYPNLKTTIEGHTDSRGTAKQ